MHVISRRPFNDAIRAYPNCTSSLVATYKTLNRGHFKTPEEMRSVFPTLDNFKYKDKWWVIDIAGNDLRLIAFIEFRDLRMFVKHIVTHSDYDKLCDKYRRGR